MMIAASEPQEFVPFGRQQLLNHPKVFHAPDQNHVIESTLLNRFSQVAISDSSTKKESWILRLTDNDGVECEEELYFKDKTVVWSIGPSSVDNRTNRVLKCCYTGESPVQEAIWCNFHSPPDFTSNFFTSSKSFRQMKNLDKSTDNLKNCIAILNASVIKIFSPEGPEFVTSLQFQVHKIWPIKHGLMLERRVMKEASSTPLQGKKKAATDLRRQSIEQSFLQKGSFNSVPFMCFPGSDASSCAPTDPTSELPTLFSLSHPLDEISPITAKNESNSYVSNPDLKIIFTSESPSLCLALDSKTGLNAVYLIRKALASESELCWRRETRPSRRNSYTSGGRSSGSFNLDPENRSLPAFLSARTRKSLGLAATPFPNYQSSPFGSFETRTSSPLPTRPHSTSPLFGFSHYTPSRKGDSNHTSFTGTPSRIEHRMMSEEVEYAEPKPLFPQICLQCVWLESHDPKETGGEASKAFISNDIMGQKYLCYLVGLKLHLLRLDVRGDEDFSVVSDPVFLHAKDAAPLESRNMIAVIALDGGVEVYTGNVHVAKILISGVSSSIATSSYLSDFNAGPIFFTKPSPGQFPKRSSLLPQSVPLESPVFNDSLSQFSPVTTCSGLSPTLPTSREGALMALKDNVGARVSLEYTSALLFRLELPHFGNSPLVESVMVAMRSVLPRVVAIQFLIKWYSTRNAPGCYNLCLQEEFHMFSSLLYSSIGYDVEALCGNQMEQTSPVTRPKKQRTSQLQSDQDWAALIGSQHHVLSSRLLPPLALPALKLSSQDFPTSPEILETPRAPSRSSLKGASASSTPALSENPKRVAVKQTIAIEETPMTSKMTLGKGRIQSSRFLKSLDKEGNTPCILDEARRQAKASSALRNRKALLHPHLPLILKALHLLYEDLKVNTLRGPEQELLVPILYQLARDLGCDEYVHQYWTDFPSLCRLVRVPPLRPEASTSLPQTPPSIFRHLNHILSKAADIDPYPYVKGINERSKHIIEVFGLMCYETESKDVIFKKVLHGVSSETPETDETVSNSAHRVVLHLTKIGMTRETLQTLPAGVALCIYEALYRCRDDPAPHWDLEAYKLAERHDLASLCRSPADKQVGPTNKLAQRRKTTPAQPESDVEDDGMEEMRDMDTVKLRWAADQRTIELRRMLQSALPVRIAIQQRPEVSDHEFLQEQERHLYAICARTMALPVARGMVTLSCANPVITEKLAIPQLCLMGKVPPTDKVVEMSHIEVPSNMNDWPLFHNGVAAGLRISSHAPNIDSEWIIYNKPKSNLEEQIEHAGFLMALGLNGHLREVMDLTIYMYLVKSHEMTRVGLMLGLAVSRRGSMDVHTLKMVSVHVEAMLPPTGIELDVDVIVEPAALMALGLLYQGTKHRHIAQVLLQEIGRPPGPEMENSVDRESYSLAAGLALGLVVFGQGNSLAGLADMSISDTLHHFMVGGPKRPYLGSQRDKYKTPSFLIFEGPLVNTHVTGPGATLALGMLYFNTGNKAVAEWLKVPETQHLLETVLPDALLLRTLAKSLILWGHIVPSQAWVLSHVPAFVLPHCLVKPLPVEDSATYIDYETMNQAYCNIVAGACMAIGLRFAGSAHEEAFQTLSYFAEKLMFLLGRSIAELCGRATIETCLNVVTVSLGMVMAGTGNLEVMRLCRYLRSRVGPSNSVVTYGSHLATHMALGLLFLGGGTLTLSTSPDAIAALLCAFYPKWPICSSDNRYHLQALRHLYVLAVEPRLLLPRDIDTRTLCYAHVTYVYLDESMYEGKVVKLLAPCLLPELNLLKEVRIEDDRYWAIRFDSKNWNELKKLLSSNSFVDVKRRAGFLSYIDDPQGFRSLLAQTLTSDDTIPWGVKPPSIYLFSSNPILENFLKFFFDMKQMDQAGEAERKTLSAVTNFTYFCLTKDKLSLLPHWLTLIKLTQTLATHPSTYAVWQWKLVLSQSQRSHLQLIPPDIALSVKQDILSLLNSWEPGVLVQVKDYLLGNFDSQGLDEGRVAAYLTFHGIPYRGKVDFARFDSGDMSSALIKLTACGTSPPAILAILSLFEF